jgi:hypothetical protein
MKDFELFKGKKIEIKHLSDDEFIKLHQTLEDFGFKMYVSTKKRIRNGIRDFIEEYDYIHNNSGNEFCGYGGSDYQTISPQEAYNMLGISNQISYEIY